MDIDLEENDISDVDTKDDEEKTDFLDNEVIASGSHGNIKFKKSKKGILYLSTIPLYMNVTRIREFFGQFGTIGRVYMQLAETGKI